MARKRKAWQFTPGKTPKASLTDALKAEVESKAMDLIEDVLKPKYIQPPPENAEFNYITDIGSKWYRNYFYFVSTYACPGLNAISPTFEEKFDHQGGSQACHRNITPKIDRPPSCSM